ncbi:MAG: folylpolyglutamate synthase/dihydrofolate synthase family protein [Hyphomonadaceae bacterium]|nr:folylpolyglutamate synthase/dihydrofolate synthase family protein [Hyphomonadaceae bacterium]
MMFPGDDPVSRRLAAIGHEFNHALALKLDRIEAALDALGRPHDRLPPTIHVAGTNGKGSTCAFLRAIAEAAGLRTHVFSSPHLVRPNERVRLDGALVGDDAFIDAIDRVAATGLTLTYFEAMTAAAFLLFAETPADMLVLEVGLGGLFDATNVIARPAVAVIAPIDYDHTAILGATLTAIAGEKAGILKAGAPAVIARQPPEAMAVIEARAQACGATLLRCGEAWDAWPANGRLAVQTADRLLDLPAPALEGPHQFDNAGLAVAALMAWADPRIDDAACAQGVRAAVWPARMQRLTQGPFAERVQARGGDLWLDGGHNPHGARAVAATLRALRARDPRPVVLVCGMLVTKDVEGFLAPLAPEADAFVAAPVRSAAGRAPAELAALAAAHGIKASAEESIDAAIETACVATAAAPRILICGSLYLAGEVLAVSGGVA